MYLLHFIYITQKVYIKDVCEWLCCFLNDISIAPDNAFFNLLLNASGILIYLDIRQTKSDCWKSIVVFYIWIFFLSLFYLKQYPGLLLRQELIVDDSWLLIFLVSAIKLC